MAKKAFHAIQRAFLAKLGRDAGFLDLFELLDDVAFFVKDRNFRLVFANPFFHQRLGLESEVKWIGKDDFELFPQPLAAKFRKDDEAVITTGRAMPRLVELFLNRQGVPDWYVTNKLPVVNATGGVIGVMGTVQRYDKAQGALAGDPEMELVIQRMRRSPAGCASIAQLASDIGLSHRQLDRRFKQATGLTPQQYLIRVRIEQACGKLRETEDDLSEIAYELGFCDQSAFTAQFRKRMGMTPGRYRRDYGGGLR